MSCMLIKIRTLVKNNAQKYTYYVLKLNNDKEGKPNLQHI